MPPELREKLVRQGYDILGDRGAFKACQWQKKSLLLGDVCYKQRFYGIESHRCIQITPLVDKCNQECQFCWRVTPSDIGVTWDQTHVSEPEFLEPKQLLDAAIMANLRSLGGFNPKVAACVSEEKYREAREPRHVAISLAGEPTLYPVISGLIDEIKRRRMTSFLVTNGTRPEVLSRMSLPTQLYVTLAAPDEETYRALCRPKDSDGWTQLNKTQELLSSLKCRRVNRLTMVAGRNMYDVRSYARLVMKGEPDYVEVKGYMFLGTSRQRLSLSNAPSHRDIRAFAEKLSSITGYRVLDEQVESRVVLLSRDSQIERMNVQ
ncbi:MAG: 4-demethylwyosine synthase TYW1 [Candidatus Thorarchaeota archaeon]|nr:MAG: 4-demethylwyosine synthase TYW1 [Candidatus Thorarchaeota archaeon]